MRYRKRLHGQIPRAASGALPALLPLLPLLPLPGTLSALPVPGLEIAETLHDTKEVVSFPFVYRLSLYSLPQAWVSVLSP